RNIGVRNVVRGKQHRALGGWKAEHTNAKPENPTTPAVIENGQGARPPATQGQTRQLRRHQAQGPGEIEREARKPQRRRTHLLKPPMCPWTAVRNDANTSR